MALSAFGDRSKPPRAADLAAALGDAVAAWNELHRRLAATCGPIEREWGFSGKSTGWGLRLKHEQRVVLYMTPCRGHFLVSFVLGERAVAAARVHGLPQPVLAAIDGARRYAEGRGVRFEVRDRKEIPPLEALAAIKLAN